MTCGSTHIGLCERYALEADCVVVLVDYRLAPRHVFPTGFNDCYSALIWVRENAAELGVDLARIAVMGDSAGGALAAGVAQKALDNGIHLCAQALIYPVLDSECKTASAREFSDTPLWNSKNNVHMWAVYLRSFGGVAPEYAAPGLRHDLRELPRCYIETAEFDPLRDEGLAYADALKAQGVKTDVHKTYGTIHGYEIALNNPQTQISVKKRIEFLRQCFE